MIDGWDFESFLLGRFVYMYIMTAGNEETMHWIRGNNERRGRSR